MKVAIIACGFPEASLPLAKHLMLAGASVDYYKLIGLRMSGQDQALEYDKVNPFFLYHREVKLEMLPELREYYGNLPFSFHLLRNSNKYRSIPFLLNYIQNRIISLIRNQHYDVINIIGGRSTLFLHKGLRGEKIYHSVHEVGQHYDGICSSPEIESLICNKIPVHFFSESTRDRFFDLKGSDKCTTTVIPFGKFETMLLYDNGMRLKIGLDLSKPTFLFFGYITPYKGLDVLADAMRLLEEKSDMFNIIIAGRGYDSNLFFFKQQQNCYVINKILTNQEVNALNRLATAVVMPYKSASQTGIASTAFMFGNPIIASKVGALPDVIQNGINGLLVEPNEPKQLANAIMTLVENPAFVHKLSVGASNFGNGDKYDWAIITRQTLLFMRKVSLSL